jgi:hypothetical protein
MIEILFGCLSLLFLKISGEPKQNIMMAGFWEIDADLHHRASFGLKECRGNSTSHLQFYVDKDKYKFSAIVF